MLGRTRDECKSEFLDEVRHLEGGERGFGAAIAHLASGALDRLLEGVAGEDPEDDGDAGAAADLGDPPGRFAGDVIEMGGVAAEDAAEADDGVGGAASGDATRRGGEFEGAGDPDDVDRLRGDPVPPERIEAAFEKGLRDVLVEAADDDGEAPAATGVLSLKDAGTFFPAGHGEGL